MCQWAHRMMRAMRLLVLLVLASACGAARPAPAAPYRAACAAAEHWDGARCVPRGAGEQDLRRGAAALADFQPDEALPLLEQARREGPHAHAVYAAIFEQLGIAYAYLEREEAAIAAFDMVLALDPVRFLSYELSPKVTFLFERSAEAARKRPPPAVALRWPNELDVARAVAIDIDVLADPMRFLKRAALHVRRAGDQHYQVVDLTLPPAGQHERVTLPALRSRRAEVLELYLVGYDDAGNEVLRWATPDEPRRLALGYDAPVPVWRKWWVWAIAGGVVAAGAAGAVYVISQEPSDLLGGTLTVR